MTSFQILINNESVLPRERYCFLYILMQQPEAILSTQSLNMFPFPLLQFTDTWDDAQNLI